MKSRILYLFTSGLIFALVTSCSQQPGPGGLRETDGITLDADVPGTQVFLGSNRLGKVPVLLSGAELARLGVPNPRTDTNAILNSDGFAETVFILKGTEYQRFTFLVPESVRANYLPLETPWGLRTKYSGGSLEPGKSFRVDCAPLIRHDGLSLALEPLQATSDGKEPWRLKVTLTNHGQQSITGFRPALMICRSAFCPPWTPRGPNALQLPEAWTSIQPGQSLQTELTIAPAEANGLYGIYVIFSLHRDATSNHLAGDGWCYSNTKLLTVAQTQH